MYRVNLAIYLGNFSRQSLIVLILLTLYVKRHNSGIIKKNTIRRFMARQAGSSDLQSPNLVNIFPNIELPNYFI